MKLTDLQATNVTTINNKMTKVKRTYVKKTSFKIILNDKRQKYEQETSEEQQLKLRT